jgi:glyoxylase-like metal-dependent hydrolase (beta-lactamase superfamily II)
VCLNGGCRPRGCFPVARKPYEHWPDAHFKQISTGTKTLIARKPSTNAANFNEFLDDVEPTNIDHEVEDGVTLPIAGGLKVIHVPGHCAGQIALLWPQHGGVLFAADTCMNLMSLGLSIPYEDVALGRRSLERLGGLQFQVATFGHGRTILHDASSRFRKQWAKDCERCH